MGSTSSHSYDQPACADMIVITIIPEAALAIDKAIKTRIVNLILEIVRIRITMWRNMDNHNLAHILQVETLNFKGILMKYTPTTHVLPVIMTMLVPACHPQCLITKPPLHHSQNACIKTSTASHLPSILVVHLHQKFLIKTTVLRVWPELWPKVSQTLRQTPMAYFAMEISSTCRYILNPLKINIPFE